MMQILFRHKSPRAYQKDLMEDVLSILKEGRHLVAHAPTGIGKTDAVVSPALSYSLDNRKVVVYLSPKISQHMIVLDVVRGICARYDLSVKTVEFVGKKHMCIHPVARNLKGEDFYEYCARVKKVAGEGDKCPFFLNYMDFEGDYWGIFDETILQHELIVSVCEKEGACPYEVASELVSTATVVVGDYYHIFSPRVGKSFLKKLGRPLSDIILVVDEAHNLPDRIRKIMSHSLSTRTLNNAAREAAGLDLEVARDMRIFAEQLEGVAASLRPSEEREIASEDLHEWFDFDFSELAGRLEEIGTEYIQVSGKKRSALLSVARFLGSWDSSEGTFLRYIRKWADGVTVSVVKKALDPSLISRPIFESVHSAILISGTLTPPEMYRDVLGLDIDRTELREYSSPFPPKNRLVMAVPTVTTRFSRRVKSEYAKIAKLVGAVVGAIPGNVAVFFPSYDVLHGVLDVARGYISKRIFVQREDMTPADVSKMLSTFRAYKDAGAVLFAVAGGSLAEGVDYPGKDLLGVVIVGIPLAEMNIEVRALIDFYDKKFGKGWYYGYIYPAISKALQAAGRCIRSESDRGVIVFLDERYLWRNYKRAFPKDYKILVITDPISHIRAFFSSQSARPHECPRG